MDRRPPARSDLISWSVTLGKWIRTGGGDSSDADDGAV